MKISILALLISVCTVVASDKRTIKVISLGELPLNGQDVELYYLLGSGFYCAAEDDIKKVNLDATSQSLRRLHFRSLASITDKNTLILYEKEERVYVRMVPLDRGFTVEE